MEKRKRRLVRLFRAESLKTHSQFSDEIGIDRGTLAHYESGRDTPTPGHLERMAASARLTIAAGEEILELVDTLREPRVRQGRGAEDLFAELGEAHHARHAWQRLLRLRLPDRPPAAEDRLQAREQLAILKDMTEEERLGAVRAAWQLQTWALCVEVVEESRTTALQDLPAAAAWGRLAAEIAERVQGPRSWCDRIQALAAALGADILQASGKVKEARADFERAKALWHAGSDPGQLLDPSLLLDLETSLYRAEPRRSSPGRSTRRP